MSIFAVVRHYLTPSGSFSYRGLLKEPHDLSGDVKQQLHDILSRLEDGTKVEIIVKSHGPSYCAKGFVWCLVAPNTYDRVPEQTYKKIREAQRKNPNFFYRKEDYLKAIEEDEG